MGGIVRHPTLATGLIGFWSMRKGAYDDTGNGHDASIISTPIRNNLGLPYGAGRGITPRNNGYENNAQTEGLAVPANSAFETVKVGVAGWIYPHNVEYSSGDGRVIISKMSDGSYFQWALRTKGSKLEFGCKIGGTIYWATGTTTMENNRWYHVAGDYDGTNIRVYLNGVQDGIYNQSGTIDSDTLLAPRIGARMGNGRSTTTMAYGHDGLYTNFGIWNREFTTQELTDLNIGWYGGGDTNMVGFNMHGPWYRTPYPAHPDEGWWEFAGGANLDALRLPGTDPQAVLFDPAQNDNDFTVMGEFEADTPATEDYEGIFAKHDSNGVDKRCWYVWLEYQDAKFAVSKDGQGGAGHASVITHSSIISAATKHFFAGRYKYAGDGSSELKFRLDDTETTDSAAVGPVYSTQDADVQISNMDSSHPTFKLDGKQYWLAYWNRKLPDAAVQAVRDGWIDPMELFPDFYIDFSQGVKSIYVSEYFTAPPGFDGFGVPEFDVEGSPSTGGVRKPSYVWPVGTWRWKLYNNGDRLALDAVRAADLNPSGDFTIMSQLRIITEDQNGAIMAKWTTTGDQRSWLLYRTTSYFRFYTSSAGSNSDYLEETGLALAEGKEYQVAGRYIHATSDKDLFSNEVGSATIHTQNKTWSGPAYAANAELWLGDHTEDDSLGSRSDFRYFAYFDEALSDDILDEWQHGRLNPWEMDPLFYFSGGHPGASYEAEIGTGANLPYPLAAENDALRGGPLPEGSELWDYAITKPSIWIPKEIRIGEQPGDAITGSYWHVVDTAGTDGDGLALTDANGASDFNPGTSPFSLCALIRLNSGAQGYRRIVAKALNVGHYSYDMMTVGTNLSLRCRVWTPTEYGFYITNMFPSYPGGNSSLYLCCLTWEPSVLRGYVCRPSGEGATGENSIATQAGPVGQTTPDDPLGIGQTGAGGGGMLDDDIFWVGFWMGEAKSKSFFEDLYNGVLLPGFTDPMLYIDFHQNPDDIGGVYLPEVGSQYPFDVINTPVLGGTGYGTMIDAHYPMNLGVNFSPNLKESVLREGGMRIPEAGGEAFLHGYFGLGGSRQPVLKQSKQYGNVSIIVKD